MSEYQFKNLVITFAKEPVIDANQYLKILATRGLSPLTIRAYGYDLIHLLRWMELTKKKLTQINKADLFDYIQYQKDLKAKPRSINRRLVVCESYHHYLFDKPIACTKGVNLPAPHYKGRGRAGALGTCIIASRPTKLKVKVPKTLIETLTPKEVESFLQGVTRYRDISIIFMMLLCGLRSCEVLTLKKEGVDLVNHALKVQGKGSKERIVPIPENVMEVLKNYLLFERPDCKCEEVFVVLQGKRRGQAMTTSGLRSLFRYCRIKSAVKKARPHLLRHTFGTEMARCGVSYQVLQKIMGHADGSTITNEYIHLSMADITDEYKKAIKQIHERYCV